MTASTDYPHITIMIPFKKPTEYLKECIRHCSRLQYPSFDIILLPDEPFNPEIFFHDSILEFAKKPISVIPTGPVVPSEKRDKALPSASGEIIAFLDDDAFPHESWLKNAVKEFEDENVVAVGGPAVTPRNDGYFQIASGLVYSSPLCSGSYIYRYVPKERREVEDYPTSNLLVRKSTLMELGGFDTQYWPGEDTKLSLLITKELKKKIIYAPDVVVYHHRRPLFIHHLKQIKSYAIHRGYFVKKFPETSKRPGYFFPSLFVIAIIGGALLTIFYPYLKSIYYAGLFVYIFLIFGHSLYRTGLGYYLPVSIGIILTHFTYGLYFLKGLLSKKLLQ